MLARLMRDRAVLFVVLAVYFALQAAIKIALPLPPGLEESRLVLFAQWFAPDYGRLAPLPVWMQFGMERLTGVGMLSVALLQAILLFLAYALVGWSAFRMLRNPALAIMAVLGLLLQPQVAFELQRDGGASLAIFAASCLFLGALVSVLDRGTVFAYALAGLALGVLALSGLEALILPIAAAVGMLAEPGFRRRLLNWRPIVTAIVAGLAYAVPLWQIQGGTGFLAFPARDALFPALAPLQSPQVIAGLFSLVVGAAGFVLPAFVVFWVAFGRRFPQSWSASSRWTRFVGVTIFVGLLFMLLRIVPGGAERVGDRSLIPILFLLPLYAGLKLDALNQTIGNAPQRFGLVAVVIMLAVTVALAVRPFEPLWGRMRGDLHVPYAAAIRAILDGHHAGRPAEVRAEDARLAANIRLAEPDLSVTTPESAGVRKAEHPATAAALLLVWRQAGATSVIPDALAATLAADAVAGANVPVPKDIALPPVWPAKGEPLNFGYAWIGPIATAAP
jgi:hypothetical protein